MYGPWKVEIQSVNCPFFVSYTPMITLFGRLEARVLETLHAKLIPYAAVGVVSILPPENEKQNCRPIIPKQFHTKVKQNQQNKLIKHTKSKIQ